MSIYLTEPVARPAIWGGRRLREAFAFPKDFGDDIGQAWVFSAQDGAGSPIKGGGWTLNRLWTERPELFKSRYGMFPFIISLVAPEDDLSVQVHPDSVYAAKKGYAMGKNEAWYFIKPPACGHIIYGHRARDRKELARYIENEAWNELALTLPVQKDAFVYLPAGVMHALKKGCLVYEVQQATDVTYRFFDYHRKDSHGKERPLQLAQAIECLSYDLSEKDAHPPTQTYDVKGGRETVLVSNDSFTVRRLSVLDECRVTYAGYQLFTVIDGAGLANGISVHMGSSFLLPWGEPLALKGAMVLLSTSEK